MNIKQKVKIKKGQMNIDNFSNQALCELTDFLFWFIQIKMKMVQKLKTSSTKGHCQDL